MIFVTVGSQMPFDRLIRAVDEWAEERDKPDVFAQVGRTDYMPRHMGWTAALSPADYRQRVFDADVIIAHAGMGSIITALQFGKPILVMPRRGPLGETRNDHQVATAARFRAVDWVTVAMNEHELAERLASLEQLTAPRPICSHASLELLTTVRDFIAGDPQMTPANVNGGGSHRIALPPMSAGLKEYKDVKAA
ncbi:MAG: glycosyltransferase [Phycisphaerales bacterium]